MPVADQIRSAMELGGSASLAQRIPKGGALSPKRDVLATEVAVAAVVARSWLDDVRQFLRITYKNPVFGMLAACATCLVRCRALSPRMISLSYNPVAMAILQPPSLPSSPNPCLWCAGTGWVAHAKWWRESLLPLQSPYGVWASVSGVGWVMSLDD